jgi:hypothetical protein
MKPLLDALDRAEIPPEAALAKAEMRAILATQKAMGGNIWKVLCSLVPRDGNVEQTSELDATRLQIVQAMAHVLLLGENVEGQRKNIAWKKLTEWIEEPAECQTLFTVLQIPEKRWTSMQWLQKDASLPEDEGGVSRSLKGLVHTIYDRFCSIGIFREWLTGTIPVDAELRKRVAQCADPAAFEALFVEYGFDNREWMDAKDFTEYPSGAQLLVAITSDPRFNQSYTTFLSWMAGERGSAETIAAQVRRCCTKQDFLDLFFALGVPGDRWRSGWWLMHIAKLPQEQKGIGKSFAGLRSAIAYDPRFGGYDEFVAWMDGKEKPDAFLRDRFKASSNTPDEVLALLRELGVPGDEWRNVVWIQSIAGKPKEVGGIGVPLNGFYKAVYRDERFGGSWRKFVSWMDGKKRPDPKLAEKVRACSTRFDYLVLFAALGIPEGKWESSHWLQEGACLPAEQGGIGKHLGHLCQQLSKQFGGFRKFLAFMGTISETEVATLGERVAACKEPQDFLMLFAEMGIPADAWRTTHWLCQIAQLPPAEGGIGKNTSGLHVAILRDPRFQKSFKRFVAWMDGRTEQLPDVRKRFSECQTQEQVRTFINELEITGELWRTARGLIAASRTAKANSLQGLWGTFARAVKSRFTRYRFFVEWMDTGNVVKETYVERVAACSTPQEFLRFFDEFGIPGDKWRNREWMKTGAVLPPEHGGIGRKCVGVLAAILGDGRFSSYPRFVRWMDRVREENRMDDGPEENNTDLEEPAEVPLRERVQQCPTPERMLLLFTELGIPGGAWRKNRWFSKAHLPVEQGGIGRSMWTVGDAILKRFGTQRNFLRWMDGKAPESRAVHSSKRVRQCRTPEEFLAWFTERGITGDEWKSKQWMVEIALLPKDQGGIAQNCSDIAYAIISSDRFERSYKKFLAWMEGKALDAGASMPERVNACKDKQSLLDLFIELGIPEGKWRSSNWLERTALLPVEDGGGGKSYQSVAKALRKRFGTFPAFVAWMDGATREQTANERIASCTLPQEYLAMFRELGVLGDQWKNFNWLVQKAKLPPEDGGIGRGLSGYAVAISKRFKGYRHFVAWMAGKEKHMSLRDRVAACKVPNDFQMLFAEFTIPGDAWKSSLWMSKVAKLPEEQGGIGRHCSGLYLAIVSDDRFESYPHFVAWMEGKHGPLQRSKLVERIASSQSRSDFLELFTEIGIPGDAWKKSDWLVRGSSRSREEGGIERNLTNLYNLLRNRFVRFAYFVAWMEGAEFVEKILSPEHAQKLLQQEALRLGVTAQDLLLPKQLNRHLARSPILKMVLAYFEDQ